jgi:hypothetical protein
MTPNYFARLRQIESGGNDRAMNPKSSAKGRYQFIDSTARQYGITDPFDVNQQEQAVRRLTEDNRKTLLKALGREPTLGELYLAHQQGAGGAAKLLSNPSADAGSIVGTQAIALNGGIPGITAGQFGRKWTAKFDGSESNIVPASYQPPEQEGAPPMKNLLGFKSPYTPEMTQLLGVNPKEMRQQALFAGLAQAGARLAETGSLGGAIGGFSEGVNQGRQGYMDERLMGYQMQQGAEDRAMRQQDRQMQMTDRQQQEEERKRQKEARDRWLANPADQKLFAEAFPEEYARQYSQTLFPSAPQPPAPTSDMRELEQINRDRMSKGEQPIVLEEYIRSKKGNGITVGPDGTVQIGGMPGKLTEQQSKDVGFYNRASQVAPLLDSLDTNLLETASAIGSSVPFVGNKLQSDGYRQATQAGNEFLTALLRKDTGAAVGPGEVELYGGTYLPRVGDDQGTVMQKRAARARALEGIRMGLGPAEILFRERQLMSSGAQGGAPQPQGQPMQPQQPQQPQPMQPKAPSLDDLVRKYGG